MEVRELNRSQIEQLKQYYMMALSEEGIFCEVMYGDGEERDVSTDEIANADSLISDEFIYDHYDGVSFDEGDFIR